MIIVLVVVIVLLSLGLLTSFLYVHRLRRLIQGLNVTILGLKNIVILDGVDRGNGRASNGGNRLESMGDMERHESR